LGETVPNGKLKGETRWGIQDDETSWKDEERIDRKEIVEKSRREKGCTKEKEKASKRILERIMKKGKPY